MIRIFLNKSKPALAGFLIYLTVWQILSLFFAEYIVPSPVKVLRAVSSFENTGINILHTFLRITVSFAASFCSGITIAVIFHKFALRDYIRSSLTVLQIIPGTILALILFLIFGSGSAVPVLLIAAVIFPLFVNHTFNCLDLIPQERTEACKLFGGGKADLARYVWLPELIPMLKETGNTAISLGSKIVILGEFIGSDSGIGYALNNAKTFFKMDEVFGYLLIIILLNFFLQIAYSFFLKILFLLSKA